jgi:hypothetical protein
MLLATKEKSCEGVIQRLPVILEEIQPKCITHWVLQYIDVISTYFFHYSSVHELEVATKSSNGVMVNDKEFMKFVANIIDFCSGTIIALSNQKNLHIKFVLENFDSCEWIIATNDKEIIKRLISFGWQESEYPPQRNDIDYDALV